mmetsp:Transcript_65201/g.155686  ORF Transcript_65201/g.155686 Transcript_65201/m.155686 type:complete len:203 (+) Transcript_65201:123-731(+)|eukprot:CAMPEP_0178444590 /NCGR_PEP_ID=MMETSP0689_2-20121128/39609_1 /TAXON_ID=160604 /ORGANISM="Amphidinium massartii, Strain CS-259" /LENGTH=202 /DNA_ID=CAMNT_0020068873 /DNA_START=122 /DNA_END=730 /DNA_ORIENTATION=-
MRGMRSPFLLWPTVLVWCHELTTALTLKILDSERAYELPHLPPPTLEPAGTHLVAPPAPAPEMDVEVPVQDEDPQVAPSEEYMEAVINGIDLNSLPVSLEAPLERQAASDERGPSVPRNLVKRLKDVGCLEHLQRDKNYKCPSDDFVDGRGMATASTAPPAAAAAAMPAMVAAPAPAAPAPAPVLAVAPVGAPGPAPSFLLR